MTIRIPVVVLLLMTLVATTARFADAQQSPPAAARATIGGKSITIAYSAPSVRGRQIFGSGGLLSKDPTYPVWRAGANNATTLRTDAELVLGALTVPRGTYTLFVNVADPNSWELIVNRQTGQSGLEYDAKQDLGRIKMSMSKPPAAIETLRYEITDGSGGRGELRLLWEQHVASVAFIAR